MKTKQIRRENYVGKTGVLKTINSRKKNMGSPIENKVQNITRDP